jgi:hypothetical protein
MESIIEGFVYPKIFKAVYSNRTVQPIERICNLPFGFELYKVVRPKYMKRNIFKYKDDLILKMLCLGIEIKIRELEFDKMEEVESYDYYPKIANLNNDDRLYMVTCYNRDKKYIGTVEDTWNLMEKYNIIKFETTKETDKVCSIGFDRRNKKWYGWSHRAIYGFTIGSKVKKGSCGFVPSSKEEFLEGIIKWYDYYDDIKTEEGITVDGKPGIRITGTNKTSKLESNTFEIYPEKWGKGEWEAKTLEDAKQMAIDFANGVS